MKMYIGLTDYNWYTLLKDKHLDEVNFWRPGSTGFAALQPNDLFLFKLKKPYYAIVGGAFFVRYVKIPINMAWDTFGEKNGTVDEETFYKRINDYRNKNRIQLNLSELGCIILTEPFFFEKKQWIRPTEDWPSNVVTGKVYDTEIGEGQRVYADVMAGLSLTGGSAFQVQENNRFIYTKTKHRLGQGGFRIEVTESYNRRCAISGEKTLPVLQAAHILPFAKNGPNEVKNGLLLRSDIHELFDIGYITVTPDYEVRVSPKLHNDYGNGKMYYQFDRQKLIYLPEHSDEKPSKQYLEWHNDMVFMG